jgi:Na+-driven multidrug efflux pump
VGCLPLPILFLLGALIGRAFWGNTGMLWGCGIGLVLGLVSAGAFIWFVRNDKDGKK